MRKKLASLLGLCTLLSSSTIAQNVAILPANTNRLVGLTWDASPEPQVKYKVYSGPSSRSYTNTVDAGTNTSVLITNLANNANYYFAATAYDTTGLESDFSNEVGIFTGPPPLAYSTNINGNYFYVLKQTRFVNDNIFRYLQSTTGTNNWTRPVGVIKTSETALPNNSFSTTWKVPAPVPLPTKMYFENEWFLEYENPSLKPNSTRLKIELK